MSPHDHALSLEWALKQAAAFNLIYLLHTHHPTSLYGLLPLVSSTLGALPSVCEAGQSY